MIYSPYMVLCFTAGGQCAEVESCGQRAELDSCEPTKNASSVVAETSIIAIPSNVCSSIEQWRAGAAGKTKANKVW